MTVEEIMARFETQKLVELKRMEADLKKLKQQVFVLEVKMSTKVSNIDKEQNDIANKLDKEFPKWRVVLVQHLQKENK